MNLLIDSFINKSTAKSIPFLLSFKGACLNSISNRKRIFLSTLKESKSNILNIKNKPFHTKHGKHNFMAFGLVPSFELSKTRLGQKLSKLMDGSFGTLIRAKGYVNSENGMLGFNYVDGTYEIIQITKKIKPSVCFIGESLDKMGITDLFGK